MKSTYIHHSSFLVETDNCYYLFDYEKGCLPEMDMIKPILVLSSHGHHDHYNPQIFSMLENIGMQNIYAVLSDDIEIPENVNVLSVASGTEYDLLTGKMTVYTDGVAIRKKPKAESRANQVYLDLVAAAEALLALVKGRKGRTNKENSKLTSQIRTLIDKWKE